MESANFLLSVAAEAGFVLTKRQLARWHRAGLLPKPKQEGLGRHKGSQSLYPEGTAKQLLAICELMKKERRLEHLSWQLWWQGFDIDLEFIRDFIAKRWHRWDLTVGSFIDRRTGRLKPTIVKAIKLSGQVRLRNRTLLQARRRVGTDHFKELITTLISLFVSPLVGKSINSEILQKGLDMEQPVPSKKLPLWLPFGISEEQLQEASSFFRTEFAKLNVYRLSDAQILAARSKANETLMFLSAIKPATDSARIRMGLSLLELLRRTPDSQAMLIRFYLAAQQSKFADKVPEFEEMMKSGTTHTAN
jgi:hypothetical protein